MILLSYALSSGDKGSRIELSTIWIPSCRNLDGDHMMIRNLKPKLYRQLQFWSYFDLFLINLTKFDLFSIKRLKKMLVKRSKKLLKYWKCQFIMKKSIYIEKVNHVWCIFNLFWSILNFSIESGKYIIHFVATIWIRTTRSDQKIWLLCFQNIFPTETYFFDLLILFLVIVHPYHFQEGFAQALRQLFQSWYKAWKSPRNQSKLCQ